MWKFKKGEIVAVRFDDHSEGEDIADIIVYGRVLSYTSRKLVIETWAPFDPKAERDVARNDFSPYAISPKTIRQAWVLTRTPKEKAR